MNRMYEAMFLIDSGYASSHWDEVIGEIRGLLDRFGCEIVRLVKWDDRKLAYEIEHKKRGTYVLCFMNAPVDAPRQIERSVQLSETILRLLLVRREKMDVEEMLDLPIPSGEDDIVRNVPPEVAEAREAEEAAAAEQAKAEAAEQAETEGAGVTAEPSGEADEQQAEDKSAGE